MQISEQHLPAPQLLPFRADRLLHLYDQFSSAEHGVSIRHDLGARGLIIAIPETRTCSGEGFDHNLMAFFSEFAHRRRHGADAVFVILDLLRHADEHGDPHCC